MTEKFFLKSIKPARILQVYDKLNQSVRSHEFFECASLLNFQRLGSFIYLASSKKYRCLINNRTKVFYLIFKLFFAFNKGYPKLDFETQIVKIH